MRKTMIPAVFLAPFATILLVAQSYSGGPPTAAQMVAAQVARLTALLTLTSAQQTQATTIFTAEQTTISGLRTSLDTARTALDTAVQANNTSAISTEATQIGGLMGQEVLARATADASFYAILTSSQQTTYNNAKLGGLLGPGGHGHGGPGGPHP